ncbi:MAG: hypothetical protein Q7S33_00230 [Nanoarchaeota archaeon]|nr:hypothetical protein [Nanoarchaeota archaeon]
MKGIRNFKEFIKAGIVKIQTPDKSRAEFLIKEAEQGYNYLLEVIEKIGIKNENANDYIKRCYDILMELVRAKMLVDGYNASGYGAHEAEVSYLRTLDFREIDVQFADQMRFFRNGMLYYGTILDKEYAEKVIKFTKENYLKLKKMS